MAGIYLGACTARHPSYDIVYQDIDERYGCDLSGSMLDIDLSLYDFVICTPPCNWWSKANPYWFRSYYAWATMNLLPLMIINLSQWGKPFLIENVINRTRFKLLGIYRLCEFYKLRVIEVGRHTYITNVMCYLDTPQHQDFKYGGKRVNDDGYNQGGSNVHAVVDRWLDCLFNGGLGSFHDIEQLSLFQDG